MMLKMLLKYILPMKLSIFYVFHHPNRFIIYNYLKKEKKTLVKVIVNNFDGVFDRQLKGLLHEN